MYSEVIGIIAQVHMNSLYDNMTMIKDDMTMIQKKFTFYTFSGQNEQNANSVPMVDKIKIDDFGQLQELNVLKRY